MQPTSKVKVNEAALISMMSGGVEALNEKSKIMPVVKSAPNTNTSEDIVNENKPSQQEPSTSDRQAVETLPPLLINNKWEFIPDTQINDGKTYASIFFAKEKTIKNASAKISVDTWNNINTIIWHVFGTSSISRANFINNILRHHLHTYKKHFDFESKRKFEDIFSPAKKKPLDKIFADKFLTERTYFYNNDTVQIKPDWVLCQAVRLFLQGHAKSISTSNYIENVVCNHLDNYIPLYKDIYENIRRI